MSSLRNSIQRRPHRERAQPLERRRLGLLEKHKDYTLRSKDFNKKKAQLKSLREKAADRNEDEFYFGMMSRKGPGSRLKTGKRWTGTIEGDRGNKSLDTDTVRLLKTQDLGYVRTTKQVAVKELARLEEQVVLTRGLDRLDQYDDDDDDDENSDDDDDDEDGGFNMPTKPKTPRKIIFLDDEAQRDQVLESQTGRNQSDDDDEDGQSDNNKKGQQQQTDEQLEREKSLRRLKGQLEHARKKVKTLTSAERELEVQRAKMAKTATSGGLTRRGKKIMVRRRKR